MVSCNLQPSPSHVARTKAQRGKEAEVTSLASTGLLRGYMSQRIGKVYSTRAMLAYAHCMLATGHTMISARYRYGHTHIIHYLHLTHEENDRRKDKPFPLVVQTEIKTRQEPGSLATSSKLHCDLPARGDLSC